MKLSVTTVASAAVAPASLFGAVDAASLRSGALGEHVPMTCSLGICSSLSDTDKALVNGIVKQLANKKKKNSSEQALVERDDVVSNNGNGRKLGCGFLDLGCATCDICEAAYAELIGTGSAVACGVTCVATVEGLGAGPEDPVADAVAVGCPGLCEAMFDVADITSAKAACHYADLC